MKGKIITVKGNKGGIGKSFITTNIAHAFAIAGKKTLIITDDTQNNILNYMQPNREMAEKVEEGIISCLKGETPNTINLRENLKFIGAEGAISNKLVKKVPELMEKLKKEFDYIVVDCAPALFINRAQDLIFLEVADIVIIPTTPDESSVQGLGDLIMAVTKHDSRKLVVINKMTKLKSDKEVYDDLKEAFHSTNFFIDKPIMFLDFLRTGCMKKRKTIWEVKDKKIDHVREAFVELIKEVK